MEDVYKRQVKVKGVRVMHEISNIFTKEKTISSLEVAEMVEKKHYNLIRDIKGYVDELTELKIEFSDFFRESTYKDSTGRKMCIRDSRNTFKKYVERVKENM